MGRATAAGINNAARLPCLRPVPPKGIGEIAIILILPDGRGELRLAANPVAVGEPQSEALTERADEPRPFRQRGPSPPWQREPAMQFEQLAAFLAHVGLD